MPNFQKLLSRKHATLVDSILVAAWNDKDRFDRITSIPDFVRNLEIIDGDFYFDLEWVDAVMSKYKNESPQFFIDFVNKGYAHGDRLVDFARKAKNSPDDALAIFKQSVELLKDLLVFLPETHPLAKAIEKKLTELFAARGLSDEKIYELLLTVSKPVKLNGPALEAKELREIKNSKWDNDQARNKALQAHAVKFEYLGYREPFSKGYDVDFFKQRLNDSLNENVGLDIGLDLSAEEKRYVDLMREFVYFRNYRTEKLYEALYYLEPVWEKASESLGLDPHDLFYYLLDELSALLKDGKKIDQGIIAERKNGYALLLHDDKVSIVTGNELVGLKKIREGKHEIADFVKGMAASKGIARGKVKIIFKASDQFKVEDGDILVTPMTTPDFIPCMQKAVAFVTDEGGITCHAAIVAREMNKPCIIGTKTATRVFKDGDMVEVDASKGIVRKIV